MLFRSIVRVGNVKPIAAGYLNTFGQLFTGDSVTLNGYPSYDPDGDALTYQWKFSDMPQGSSALLLNSDTPVASFTIDKPGGYVAQLIVNDGALDSKPAAVYVRGVQPCVENFAIRPKSTKIGRASCRERV